ncbi:Chorismate synthase [Piscirickettsia salmonis]|uniref:chorismate synthase n=1 Tax=Piscirickettsia salmonis TaxID=1238 RepID=UPI0012BAD3F4|nr:chorismate synthase [Piscirickettsia salmonis]QGP55094.1 Chorismate synthase [Piscirickettsia salmonis]QGP59040.1 Chorismate synthase [Piscirickettsia salmonis]QGP64662.1 Chorismate synthase [Piscirickettsia salmonis]
MASNSFGQIFRITTWGESHGKGIGVVIDGCPAGLALSEDEINAELDLRVTGKNRFTSPRKEKDHAEIYSGVFAGKTTGAPVSIVIHNHDADSSKYEPIKDLLRPGHANYTYLEKYGVFDYRGGGRSSARETACRVAAGAVAKKLLAHFGVKTAASIQSIGSVDADLVAQELPCLKQAIYEHPLYCADTTAGEKMMAELDRAIEEGDSLGGIIQFSAIGLPVGIGDPVYEKLEANLAKAMMSLPATKGMSLGEGFAASRMQGSEHNDLFAENKSLVTNHAGGTLGGISTGECITGQVAFKPTSSIKKVQATANLTGEKADFTLPTGSRHDPCVAIRAVPVVESMLALVLADALLVNRAAKL